MPWATRTRGYLCFPLGSPHPCHPPPTNAPTPPTHRQTVERMFSIVSRRVGASSTTLWRSTATATRGFANAASEEQKSFEVYNLLEAKKSAGLTYDEIAHKTGTCLSVHFSGVAGSLCHPIHQSKIASTTSPPPPTHPPTHSTKRPDQRLRRPALPQTSTPQAPHRAPNEGRGAHPHGRRPRMHARGPSSFHLYQPNPTHLPTATQNRVTTHPPTFLPTLTQTK